MARGDGGWEGRREGGGRVVYWGLLLCGGRERRDSVVMARKSWEEGGGWRRVVGGVVGGRGPRLGQGGRWEGGRCPSPGDFDLRFFLTDVLEMGWFV